MSYKEPSSPELIIQHTGQIFSLGAEPITIGNQQDNVIVLADPQVSPHHAVIAWQAETGVFTVEDVGSTEGTFLNEVPVEEPQILRHGDVLRMGNTVMDLRLQPSPEVGIAPLPIVDEGEKSSRSPVLTGILIALLVGACIVCVILFATVVLTGGTGTPDIIIQSPAAGAQIGVGNEIILQATASGAKDITLLELNVDGSLVATASDPEGTSSLTVSKAWRFTAPGEHVISADAYTASGKTSRPASVKVTVVEASAQATATPSPAPEEPTETPVPTETSTPRPEDTATPVPTTVPPPQIEYFQSSPSTINVGGCATLQWGRVTNATEASIEPDIGGVGTPGSEKVCPLETTTYFLTATGPGGTTQAATTVTVIGALPDLTIDSITFDPSPAAVGQETKVQITIQNIGAGAAGAFSWEWEAGPQEIFDGRIFGLNAGDSTVVTVNWTPGEPNDSLTTEARVDTEDEVDETDEGNNTHTAIIQVVELPSQPETVTLKSEGALDGYWLNDGSGSSTEDILVGNGEEVDPIGELVARGFMSFDVSGIPAGSTIDSVELRFYQKEVQGDPYGKLGNLVLEQVDYGSSLGDSAYHTPALASAMLDMQTDPGAWYIISDPTILSWVQSNLEAGRSRFQLRLQFRQETDGDRLEDWVAVEPGGGVLGSRNAPQLTVTYTP
ncbi:MAG: CARDB domain-containing protein [Anaerolineae bacterium]|jgi:pSer/pThr/pTyr-binding forkhead associated (FHA) protein